MGHRARRPFALALRVLASWTLAFAVCLLLPSIASAETVPMCGELGQSIEAPPPLYPGKGDVLAPSCVGQRHVTVSADETQPPSEVTQVRHLDRHVALPSAQLLPRVRSVRLDVPPAQADERRPGFAPTLERPPRRG